MNRLAKESSPYLLQHKNNPVDWFPWGEEAFEKAKQENKLVLVSVGYSACHWCHVMEKECFENDEVAAIMNEHFVAVKVDREERPDVDQVYMEAVQLMNQQGGWPLNCFTLPDGKPFYGGTYFPKQNWINVLLQLSEMHRSDPEKLKDYAENLTERIQEGVLYFESSSEDFSADILAEGVKTWSEYFDSKNGGTLRAPKFPLPGNYSFLLRYALLTQNNRLQEHVLLTLHKMAQGGIYDQIGGGFSRYSVDKFWKVPHFEKMLYDNAQLISLYAEAYSISKNETFQQVVTSSIAFCKEELYNEKEGFYCALDADSEGVEGKFYVWSLEELKTVLEDDFELAKAYFNLNEHGFWEGNYVLLRKVDDEVFASDNNLSLAELRNKVDSIAKKLKTVRDKRIKPGLDNKVLTSWNALMVKALCLSYLHLGRKDDLQLAKKTMLLLLNNHSSSEGELYRTMRGEKPIPGFLDDYALTIDALLNLYQADLNEFWLSKAKELTDLVLDLFYSKDIDAFYYNSGAQNDVVVKKIDMHDDVIPSSNSVMAHNLHSLSILYGNEYYHSVSKKLLQKVISFFPKEISNYSNWAALYNKFVFPFKEVVVTGKNANEYLLLLNNRMYPNTLIVASTKESALPLFKNRFQSEETFIFVCKENTCLAPVNTVQQALELIE